MTRRQASQLATSDRSRRRPWRRGRHGCRFGRLALAAVRRGRQLGAASGPRCRLAGAGHRRPLSSWDTSRSPPPRQRGRVLPWRGGPVRAPLRHGRMSRAVCRPGCHRHTVRLESGSPHEPLRCAPPCSFSCWRRRHIAASPSQLRSLMRKVTSRTLRQNYQLLVVMGCCSQDSYLRSRCCPRSPTTQTSSV